MHHHRRRRRHHHDHHRRRGGRQWAGMQKACADSAKRAALPSFRDVRAGVSANRVCDPKSWTSVWLLNENAATRMLVLLARMRELLARMRELRRGRCSFRISPILDGGDEFRMKCIVFDRFFYLNMHLIFFSRRIRSRAAVAKPWRIERS